MLKRIAIVAFFTGTGQLLSVFALKFISTHAPTSQLKAIAEIDSLVFFLMNAVALGLQSTAMRNLAQTHHWKPEYQDTQRARVTLGLLLMCGALLAGINPYYLVFLLAPLLAWSGDYALYARGYPVAGSVIAFLRLAIPYSALLAAAWYYPHLLGWIYLSVLAVVYLLTNLYINYFLGTPYFFRPSARSLHLYVSSLALGVVALSLYFLGLGLVLVIPYFYNAPLIVAVAFLGLKLYVIFKGVLRIIHQAFIKEMIQYAVCLRVDQLCTLIGLGFAGFTACFPASFIRLFFGEPYVQYRDYFILLSVAALIYSLFSSLTTKAMLEKKDRSYAVVAASTALLTIILCIIFSMTDGQVQGIGISLLAGELAFAAGMLFIMHRPAILKERLLFLAMNLPLMLIPFGLRYLLGDVIQSMVIAAGIFGILTMGIYYRKFKH